MGAAGEFVESAAAPEQEKKAIKVVVARVFEIIGPVNDGKWWRRQFTFDRCRT